MVKNGWTDESIVCHETSTQVTDKSLEIMIGVVATILLIAAYLGLMIGGP